MAILGVFLTVVSLIAFVRGLGIPRVAQWLLALQTLNTHYRIYRTLPGARTREDHYLRTTTVGSAKIITIDNRPWYSCQRPNPVLSPVQQDVLSALVNLRMPFHQAEQAVLECFKVGDSFEDLFKRATPPVQRTA